MGPEGLRKPALTYPGAGVVAELEALQAAGRSDGPRAGLLGMEPGRGVKKMRLNIVTNLWSTSQIRMTWVSSLLGVAPFVAS